MSNVEGASVPRDETPRARALRLLSQQRSRSRLVTVSIGGEDLLAEVRSPNLRQRRAMHTVHKDDPAKQNLWGIIDNTYEPGPLVVDAETGLPEVDKTGKPTNRREPGTKKMFEQTDLEVLLLDPSGGFIDVLSGALGEMLKEDMQRADDLAKK